MTIRNLWPLPLLLIAALSFLIPGCDKLVTQVTNTTLYDSTLGEKCLRCHGDAVVDDSINQPRGQWAKCRHASSKLIEATEDLNGTLYSTNVCGPDCHTSQGFVKHDTTGATLLPVSKPAVIGCATCHSPHTGTFITDRKIKPVRMEKTPVKLASDSVIDLKKGNHCAFCHKAFNRQPLPTSGETVTLAGDWGPHVSCQADLFAKSAGFFFTGAPDMSGGHDIRDTIFGKLGCVACHYGTSANPGQGYQFGEHTFRLEDASGNQFVRNCNRAGCHEPTSIHEQGFYAFPDIDTITLFGDSLKLLLSSRRILDTTDETGRTFDSGLVVPTDLAKVLYNYLLYKLDGSQGVHNPRYVKQLLRVSLDRWDTIPHALISFSRDTVCLNEAVIFNDSSKGAVTGRTWTFRDGPVTGSPATHTFSQAGADTVKLTVTSATAGTDIARKIIFVAPPPNPLISASTTTTTTATVITFSNIDPNVTSWNWDFGDGSAVAVTKQTTHQYSAAGPYVVKLIVANGCSADSSTLNITITTP